MNITQVACRHHFCARGFYSTSAAMALVLGSPAMAQTAAADTLVRWSESNFKNYQPAGFKETVASAMNINDPVSLPRIKHLMENFDMNFYRSSEQEILKTWLLRQRAEIILLKM